MIASTFVSPRLAITFFAFAAAACGGSSSEKPPATNPEKVASAAPSVAPSAAPTAAPSAAPEAPTAAPATEEKGLAHDVDSPDGARRWALWNGPKTGDALTTERAWAVVPSLTDNHSKKWSFGVVVLQLVDVVKSDKNELVYTTLFAKDEKYAVPAALARPPVEATGLKKGSFVGVMAVASVTIGRVEAVNESIVTVAYRFADDTSKTDVSLDETLPIHVPFSLGSPVMVRFDDAEDLYAGWTVAADKDSVWVSIDTSFTGGGNGEREGRHVHKVKKANATPIDVSKPLAVGAPCLAPRFSALEPGTVKKVIDGGIAYVVTFKDWDKEVLAGTVVAAPKGAKPAK